MPTVSTKTIMISLFDHTGFNVGKVTGKLCVKHGFLSDIVITCCGTHMKINLTARTFCALQRKHHMQFILAVEKLVNDCSTFHVSFGD